MVLEVDLLVLRVDESPRAREIDLTDGVLGEVRQAGLQLLGLVACTFVPPNGTLDPTGVERGDEELRPLTGEMHHLHIERGLGGRVGGVKNGQHLSIELDRMVMPEEAPERTIHEENASRGRGLHERQEGTHRTHGTEEVDLEGLLLDLRMGPIVVRTIRPIVLVLDMNSGVHKQGIDVTPCHVLHLQERPGEVGLLRHVQVKGLDGRIEAVQFCQLVGTSSAGNDGVTFSRKLERKCATNA